MKFTQFLKNLHREESGQDLIEYALVIVAVGTAVIAGTTTLSKALADGMTALDTKIQTLI